MLRLSYAYKTSLLTRVPPRYLRFFATPYIKMNRRNKIAPNRFRRDTRFFPYALKLPRSLKKWYNIRLLRKEIVYGRLFKNSQIR
jgi:hypothetical protein